MNTNVDPALQILAQKEMPGRARAILPSCPVQRIDETRSTLQPTLGVGASQARL